MSNNESNSIKEQPGTGANIKFFFHQFILAVTKDCSSFVLYLWSLFGGFCTTVMNNPNLQLREFKQYHC